MSSRALPENKSQKNILFSLVALALPFIVLVFAEYGLRAVGFGKTVPLFVPAKSFKGMLTPNPELITRFFHLDAPTPNVSPDTMYFSAEKPKDTLRLVLMGGSTAAGFPYGRFGSPAGLLTHQLRAVYPEHDIEVIPVAMASINSYALRDFADEVIAVAPDAVLIYAGHNEYLGVMGVGSAYASYGNHVTNWLFLKLKNLRLFQFLQTLITNGEEQHNRDSASAKSGRTTMALMAKEQKIEFDSELYHAGITQFRNNMSALTKDLRDEDIPVFIGNLVANEKDQRPFSSTDPEGFAGITATLSNRMATSEKLRRLESLLEKTETSAAKHSANIAFTQGTLLLQQQQTSASIKAFTDAADYDELRFRAPSAFNGIIMTLAEQEQVTLVDMQQAFRQDSQGPIGDALMLEHLHPTKRGYFLMADAFLQSLSDVGVVPAPSYPLNKTQKHRFNQVPINQVDEGVANHKIKQLKNDYPFTDSPQAISMPSGRDSETRFIVERLQGRPWLEQQQDLLRHFQQNREWLNAANVAALIVEAIPEQGKIAAVAAKLYLKAHQPRLAWYYARQAAKAFSEDENLLLSLAEAQYLSEDNEAAKATLERILAFAPDNERAAHYLKQLSN